MLVPALALVELPEVEELWDVDPCWSVTILLAVPPLEDDDPEAVAGISLATVNPTSAASPVAVADTQPKIRRPLTTPWWRRSGPRGAGPGCTPLRTSGASTVPWFGPEEVCMPVSNQAPLAAGAMSVVDCLSVETSAEPLLEAGQR
jgi:hypothetical protein